MVISGQADGNKPIPILVDSSGRIIPSHSLAYTPVWKHVALGDTDETTLWDPTTGTKFVLTDYMAAADNNAQITLRDNTSGSTILICRILQNMEQSHSFCTPIVSAAANNILTAEASAATVWITVAGYEI